MERKNDIKNVVSGFVGDRLLRTAEVLQLLKISRTTMRGLIFAGLLNPIMLGKKAQRFSSREVIEFIEKVKDNRETFKISDGNDDFSSEEKSTLHTICSEFPG